MKINTEVHAEIGFDKIDFSMGPKEVEVYLGTPYYVDEEERQKIFSYDELGFNIVFSSAGNNSMIKTIEFEKPAYTLWGKNIVGSHIDDIKNLLSIHGYSDFKLEKNDDIHCYIFCESCNMDFEFEKEVVSVFYLNNPIIKK